MWGTVAASAGVVATALFVLSSLPMLAKAARSRDLSSYSGANLLIADGGDVAQALSLTTLPAGGRGLRPERGQPREGGTTSSTQVTPKRSVTIPYSGA